MRLLKLSVPQTKGLFEEYFYAFLGIIFAGVSILLRAGGMNTYNAVVVGLWAAGFTWFAWQLRDYFKERSKPALEKKPEQAASASAPQPAPSGPLPLPPGMKPMIGPQWPIRGPHGTIKRVPWPEPAAASQSNPPAADKNKSGFVYERPKLPDRKPKLPNNWPGRGDKKPKR